MTAIRPQGQPATHTPLVPGEGELLELMPRSAEIERARLANLPPMLAALVAATRPDAAADARSADALAEAAVKRHFADTFGALAKDEAAFHQLLETVYGKDYDRAVAEDLRQRALAGDFSWLPPVRFLDAETLGGAHGAYDAESGTVFLNRSLDLATLAQTYVEEVGHHLDTKLKTEDTPGDEGELFRRLLAGEKLSRAQIREIRSEDDKGFIVVDGRRIEVEFWNPFKAIAKGVKKIAKGIGKAVKKVAKGIGKAVEGVVKGIGSVVKGVAKGIGSFVSGVVEGTAGFFGNLFRGRIGDAFGALWQGIDKAVIRSTSQLLNGVLDGAEHMIRGAAQLLPKPFQVLTDRALDAARSVITGAFDIATSAVRNVVEGAGQVLNGFGKLLRGDFKGGFKDIGVGLLKATVQTVADALLLGLGKGVSAIQTLIGLEPVGRKLTEEEIAILRQVYGDSIDYDQVRIKEGKAGLFSTNDRPFVLGNTVYMKGREIDAHLLVHEMAHVWQFQNGGSDYMSEALISQKWGHGYRWEDSVPGTAWADLEPEQQAELLADAYESGYFDGPGGRFIHNGVDLTEYLERALAEVRAGRGAP